ncbi:hypothetical protein [Actinophytocola sp.]|uniref:hypothetical protein n=1 Tax=Actinophytocola sp. TaxID=1872138 RepID=UPI00389A6E4E
MNHPKDVHEHPPVNGNVIPLQSRRTVNSEARTGGADTAYEIELDESRPAVTPLPVDTTSAVPVQATDGKRRPIIPPQLRPQNLKATARRAGGRAAHVSAFHAVRAPWYVVRLAYYAARGVLRVAGGQIRWWWVPGAYTMEQHAANTNQLLEWQRVHREVKATRMWRGIVLAAETLALVIGLPIMLALVPAAWLLLVGTGAVAGLAHYGRPAGRTLIGTAVVAPRFRKLNSDIVLRAYYAAGLGNLSKPEQQIQFGSPMSRDARNTGSQVVIDLPYGKGWSDVMNAREKIASGLDVHVNQVFLSPDKTSSRRHMLFVADRDPLAVPAGRTDMLDCKPRSIWRPLRFGKDERGNLVELTLMWVSILIGAQPRKV